MNVYQVNKLYIACYIEGCYNKTVAVMNITRNISESSMPQKSS